MSILDVFKVNQIKAERDALQAEVAKLKGALEQFGVLTAQQLQQELSELESKRDSLVELLRVKQQETEQAIKNMDIEADRRQKALHQELFALGNQINERRNQLIVLDEEILLQSFGLYKIRYNLQSSQMYVEKLDAIRRRQADMVKSGRAVMCPTDWSINGSAKEGARMIEDFSKMILRSFNNECDASITSIKFNNVDSVEKKIRKAYDVLNKLAQRMRIVIVSGYLELKLEELQLCYEYQVKKQAEKEEQKQLREQMREEARVLRELEDARSRAEKEEKHFAKALDKVNLQIQKAQNDVERESLETERRKIEEQIANIEAKKKDILKREQNTRAGYVYIISNIGAFGEDVYKIGVTRRLDPEDRVDELGDASVPFDFDIHALIFSEDAPALENALHKAFDSRRLNLVNTRREFFHVSFDEIEKTVSKVLGKPVDFNRLADASEYRQSVMLRKEKGFA